MKKSVRIYLLVITVVMAIFAFAGIWYLRPSVPNELLEQARARQLQPLLEIDAPLRKPAVEAVTQSPVDKKALAEELLPTITDQVTRALEGPLYEKLKKDFASDEAFVALISAKLEKTLNLGAQTATAPVASAAAIPQGLEADFNQQVEALRKELLASLGEGQSSFFFQIEDMLDARLNRFEDDLNTKMQAYVPQLVDKMIPTLVEMLVKEFDANKETYLPYLVQELQPSFADSLTEEDLVLLYTSYRDKIVMDLVPAILTAMEEPAKKEVAEMVKTIQVPASPSSLTSVVRLQVKAVPVVEATPVPVVEATPVPVVEAKAAPVVESMPVPTPPTVVVETKVVTALTPAVPNVPSVATPMRAVQKIEPILTAPTFTPNEDEIELFVDPIAYEEKRTEIRNKAIRDVLDRINAL